MGSGMDRFHSYPDSTSSVLSPCERSESPAPWAPTVSPRRNAAALCALPNRKLSSATSLMRSRSSTCSSRASARRHEPSSSASSSVATAARSAAASFGGTVGPNSSLQTSRSSTSGSLESTSMRVLAPDRLPCTNSVSAATHAVACATLPPSISGSSSANSEYTSLTRSTGSAEESDRPPRGSRKYSCMGAKWPSHSSRSASTVSATKAADSKSRSMSARTAAAAAADSPATSSAKYWRRSACWATNSFRSEISLTPRRSRDLTCPIHEPLEPSKAATVPAASAACIARCTCVLPPSSSAMADGARALVGQQPLPAPPPGLLCSREREQRDEHAERSHRQRAVEGQPCNHPSAQQLLQQVARVRGVHLATRRRPAVHQTHRRATAAAGPSAGTRPGQASALEHPHPRLGLPGLAFGIKTDAKDGHERAKLSTGVDYVRVGAHVLQQALLRVPRRRCQPLHAGRWPRFPAARLVMCHRLAALRLYSFQLTGRRLMHHPGREQRVRAPRDGRRRQHLLLSNRLLHQFQHTVADLRAERCEFERRLVGRSTPGREVLTCEERALVGRRGSRGQGRIKQGGCATNSG
eukprot:scaffold11076_cov100-Isochrysis_galbana.AAC.2